MLKMLKKESNITYTENGAVTLGTTSSDCLDLFASIGALRRMDDDTVISCFMRAYAENKNLAMKLLFFARDIRGGLGERRIFRTIVNKLAKNEPEAIRKNIEYFAEYGRYDDLLALFDTPVEKDMLSYIKTALFADISALENDGEISLLAKWLPSINTSSKNAVAHAAKIARSLGMTDAVYRKTLVKLRAHIKIIENNLRIKDYTFSYEKQPSKALYKYRGAFLRNDRERYGDFISNASKGKAKLHADTLSPYELVEPYLTTGYFDGCFMKSITEEEKNVLNATWNSLPDFGSEENTLAVIDTSGSMYWDAKPLPAAVALSLGLYFAEHNRGAFKNHFIEFSSKPRLVEIKGETFADKLRYITSFCEVADTNLESVFDLILKTAVKYSVPQNELPSKLIIISDMEFNRCVNNATTTNFNNAKAKFEAKGYRLPEIVFWNVASRNRHQPVTKNEQGVCLVSGCTPRLFSIVANGSLSSMTPYEFMMNILTGERYEKITA